MALFLSIGHFLLLKLSSLFFILRQAVYHVLLNPTGIFWNVKVERRWLPLFNTDYNFYRHQGTGADACTDLPCKWDKLRMITLLYEITCIDTRIDQSCSSLLVKTGSFHEEHFLFYIMTWTGWLNGVPNDSIHSYKINNLKINIHKKAIPIFIWFHYSVLKPHSLIIISILKWKVNTWSTFVKYDNFMFYHHWLWGTTFKISLKNIMLVLKIILRL